MVLFKIIDIQIYINIAIIIIMDVVIDMIMTLSGQAEVTDTGAVVGGQKVKIGTLIELEGDNYNFNTSVIDVRLPKRS